MIKNIIVFEIYIFIHKHTEWFKKTSVVFDVMMVSYIKGGIHAKGIWKQDHEANILA